MDETQNSTRVSEAAATRKRRSSILKSQRAPRTPFSELEFNVATPTDTAKSRRVSFSRRMDVAEFSTNEATNTWKKFYEEHNKSLESSGNDSAANARPSISHIGKRIFDQQFEEVEAVGFGSTLIPGSRAADFNISINNINLTQQLAAFECAGNDKDLIAPQQNFELSALTDHQSKLFNNDLTVPAMGEMSNQINVDFSIMTPMGDKCDDLDEIQRDLERPHNVVCPGPFREDNMSEYIEIDLNMTHVRHEESNMSITDTIPSPQVQDVSNSNSLKQKKAVVDKDWVAEKENIADINPYVTPCEADNFAINEVPDQVLVFDGKRLTIQTERKEPVSTSNDSNKGYYRQTLLSDAPAQNIPQRKTIVLNTNDDLPNFIDEPMFPQSLKVTQEMKQTIFDEADLSITQALPNKIDVVSEQKTINYDNTIGNITLTQAVPTNVILEEKPSTERRRTIVFDSDNANISVTQAVPDNMLFEKPLQNKRRATVYDDNISFTQVLPTNVIDPENVEKPNRTILYQNNVDDISFTQALPNNIQVQKTTANITVFDKSIGNVSMTQALPSNIILNENKETISNRRKTIVYGNDEGDISTTQAVPNLILEPQIRRQTIVFENDNADISMTQAIPANILQCLKPDTNILDKNTEECRHVTSVTIENTTKSKVPNKHLTIMYDNDVDISMTQALPPNILSTSHTKPERRKTVVFDDNADISMTQALPSNILKDVYEENVSKMDQNISKKVSNVTCSQSKSMIIDNDIIQNDEVKNEISVNKQPVEMNRKSEIGNLSMSKPIPSNLYDIENEMLKNDMEKFANMTQFGEKTLLQETLHEKSNAEILVYQATTVNESKIAIDKTVSVVEEESNKSIGNQKIDTLSTKSVKSNLSAVNNEMEITEEEHNTQTDVLIKNSTETNAIVESVEELKVTNSQQESEGKKSILHELLDMSCNSIEEIEDKNKTAVVEKTIQDPESDSNDRIFIIKKDSEDENKALAFDDDVKEALEAVNAKQVTYSNTPNEIENNALPLEYQAEQEMELNLEDTIAELSRRVTQGEKSPQQNRHYEKILSSDLQATFNRDMEQSSLTKARKSFKDADDTRELLEILSDFTDRKSLGNKDDKEETKESRKSSLASEYKTDVPDPRRLSFASRRQSIVLSREDLLNNLSMAQATLQQTRLEINDSESVADTTSDSPEIIGSEPSSKKYVRMNNEVVKTLHFEDESYSDSSLKSNFKTSPLKKTAFGETEYMKEGKAKVIPTYLKDVTDNIKALMNDLVKPRPDQMPFEMVRTEKGKELRSTCSTQIQANLFTSSQIDLEVELHSNVNSASEVNKPTLVRDALKTRFSGISDEVSEFNIAHEYAKNSEGKSLLTKPHGPVLVFDQHNPLNNVLLAPPGCADVHKYNPSKEKREGLNDDSERGEKERVTTQYRVESHIGLPSGDACTDKKDNSQSLFSDPSKPLSMDRSTEGLVMEVKDTEVNTVIVMKGNKELLEASSSLTLVDDALTQSVFDVKVEPKKSMHKESPVKVIYKLDDEEISMLENMDSDLISNDEESIEYTKGKKRSYSPAKTTTISSPDITPKPLSKMQKISKSPLYKTFDTDSLSDTNDATDLQKKKSPRKKHKRPGTDITVQQLITEYKITETEQEMIEEQVVEAIHDRLSMQRPETVPSDDVNSPDIVSSCTSSKNQSGMQDDKEASLKETVSYVGSQPSKVDWQAEIKESSNKANVESEAGVNVVAKIDMLPFMGTRECEWDNSGGDTWVFRLLRSRLRLRVRLAHKHHNALRSRVRADTPVEEITVDSVIADEKDPLAELCVRFAGEAMRYECARGCDTAGAVPRVLRRCAGVARVALKWARAMRDARFRLAYTLTKDGYLALKVANVPLRSVWEVTMRIELVVGDAREAAWPRAAGVRVAAVLAECTPAAAALRRALARVAPDWGHAPRTVWKIFRYLKNMTRDDDFLML